MQQTEFTKTSCCCLYLWMKTLPRHITSWEKSSWTKKSSVYFPPFFFLLYNQADLPFTVLSHLITAHIWEQRRKTINWVYCISKALDEMRGHVGEMWSEIRETWTSGCDWRKWGKGSTQWGLVMSHNCTVAKQPVQEPLQHNMVSLTMRGAKPHILNL